MTQPETDVQVAMPRAAKLTPAQYAKLQRSLLVPPHGGGLWGFVAAICVTLFGLYVRLRDIERPRTLVFDEIYYVKQAASLIMFGYERAWDAKAKPSKDEIFASGTPEIFLNQPDFVVHPPGGKWAIAIGQMIFGMDNPTGWRISTVVAGTLSVLLVIYITASLLSSMLWGLMAGILVATDIHHIVLSRTGLLDVLVSLWALVAFGALLRDRRLFRERLLRQVSADPPRRWFRDYRIRYWRILSAVSIGLCLSTKWSGVYVFVVFGLLTFMWDASARRAISEYAPASSRPWWITTVLRDGIPAFCVMLPTILATYLASWFGWFMTREGYFRLWAIENPNYGPGWIPASLRSLWKYHSEAYRFHVALTEPHPYHANPWTWTLQLRPTAFYWEWTKDGTGSCAGNKCVSAISAMGNPVVWWSATAALFLVFAVWLFQRDWRAGAILAPMAALYLPWFMYQDRTVYGFYSVSFLPYMVMALVFSCAWLLKRSAQVSVTRFHAMAVIVGSLLLIAVITNGYFAPISNGEVVPYRQWMARMWLHSWI